MLPGKEIPKQRGIYSEILTTEDTQNLNVTCQLLTISLVRLNFWTCVEQPHRDEREAKDAPRAR